LQTPQGASIHRHDFEPLCQVLLIDDRTVVGRGEGMF
jgi:hypothetical protein